ncbi:MAG: hypothetical protein WDN03_04030 [Rhizomicrobium sp.]
MTLANQHFHQLDPAIRSAVHWQRRGTLISFRIGAEDALYLAREFQPKFDVEDLLGLPNHSTYLKLMIDGMPSRAFSATILNSHESQATRKERYRHTSLTDGLRLADTR